MTLDKKALDVAWSDAEGICGWSGAIPEWFESSIKTYLDALPSGQAPLEGVKARGGIETDWWAESIKLYRRLRNVERAATAVITETDSILASDEAPVKYRAPYGALTKLREVLSEETTIDARKDEALRSALLPASAEQAFKPCVILKEEAGITEAVFEDCAYVAKPVIPGIHHWVDELRAIDDDRLVGIQIWAIRPPASGAVEAAFRAGFDAGETAGKFEDDSADDAWIRYAAAPTEGQKISFCSICGESQFQTPSGLTCKNDHGGADSK